MTLFGGRPKELTRALAVYGAAAPAGGTAGVFLGGVVTEWLSWPWIFWLYVPVALAALAAVPWLLPDVRPTRGPVDVAGAAAVTAGLALAVFGLVRAPSTPTVTTTATLLGAAALLGAFLVIQARRRMPLVRLGILRTPNLAAANLAQLLLGAAWIPLWFFLNLYLQQVLGLGAFAGGAALLPMTVTIMVLMVAIVPQVIGRVGPKTSTVAGLVLLGAGLLWLSFAVFLAGPDGSFAADVLPGSLIAAAGMALAFIPSLGTAIASARQEEGGLAAGLVNTSYQIGSALGLAAMTAFATAHGAADLDSPAALTHGFSMAFLGAAAIALVGAALAATTLHARRGTS
jgi:MFS family permease